MNASRDSEDINHPRRRLIGAAAMTVAAARFGIGGSADAQTGATKPNLPAIKPGTNTTFAPLKQIDAGLLNVGYAEAGPGDGPVVLLLHGWPYDIHSFVDVAPLVASAGFRVIVPYLRGYGTTRFLSGDTMRNGQQSAVALDATIALMDALKISTRQRSLARFPIGGARTADIVAALWPERCKALVSVSGYLIGSQEARQGIALAAGGQSSNGGINSISPPSAAWSATTRNGATFRSSSGGKPRPNGTSTTPRSIAARRPSTTLTFTSPS